MDELIKKYKLGKQHANKKVKWGPWASLLVSLGAYIIPTAVLVIVIAIVAVARGAEQPSDIIDANNLLQNLLLAIFISLSAVAVVFRYVSDKGGLGALGLGSFKPRHLKLGLAAYGIYFVSFFGALFVLSLFKPDIIEQAQELGFDNPAGFLSMLYVFMLLVILPPLYEEILFRGFFFQGVARAFGFLPAALAVNGLFGLAHRQWNVGIDTFILGVIASWLVWKTKSLWPAIALHAIKNLVAYTFRFVIT